MRILHNTNYFYPYINGVENICKYIVDHSKEHESSVVCFHEKRKDLLESFSAFFMAKLILKKEKMNKVTGSNFSRIFVRLDYLASLSNNWDGHGTLPVSRKVIGNIKAILLISDGEDWQDWLIGAEPNATLALQAKTKVASISIGNKEFSYYANIDGKEYGDSHVVFSPESVLNLMRSFDHE